MEDILRNRQWELVSVQQGPSIVWSLVFSEFGGCLTKAIMWTSVFLYTGVTLMTEIRRFKFTWHTTNSKFGTSSYRFNISALARFVKPLSDSNEVMHATSILIASLGTQPSLRFYRPGGLNTIFNDDRSEKLRWQRQTRNNFEIEAGRESFMIWVPCGQVEHGRILSQMLNIL